MYCDTMLSWPCSASILQSSPSFVLQFEEASGLHPARSAIGTPREDLVLSTDQNSTTVCMQLSQGQAWASALDVANLWTSSFAMIPAQSLLFDFHNEKDFSRNRIPAIVSIDLQDRGALRNSTRRISSSEAACRPRQSLRVVYLFSDRLELAFINTLSI